MSRDACRTWLIVATISYGVGGLLALGMAPFVVFLYDAPGSNENHTLNVFAFFWATLWVTAWVTAGVSWIPYALKFERVALALTGLPVVHIGCIVVAGYVLSS